MACHISLVPSLVSKACLRMVIVVEEAIVSPTVHLQRFVRQMMVVMIEYALPIVLLRAHHIFRQLVIVAVVLSFVELRGIVMVVMVVYGRVV